MSVLDVIELSRDQWFGLVVLILFALLLHHVHSVLKLEFIGQLLHGLISLLLF